MGDRICCIAITDHASPDLESICDHVKWSGVGKMGTHVKYFRRRGVQQVTMAGKLFKSELLFQGSVWLKHCPDLTAIRTFGPCLVGKRKDSRDDSLLLAVTNMYSKRSLTICPATDFAPELLVNKGFQIGKPLSAQQSHDVQFGWQVAKQMGGMDIGQSITVKDGTVLAVEAVEGTERVHLADRPVVSPRRMDAGESQQAGTRHAIRRSDHRSTKRLKMSPRVAEPRLRSKPTRRS